MHELSIAQAIVDTIGEAVADGRVTRVEIEVGALAMVVPESLRFCFDLAAAGTALADAELTIVQTPGRGRCRVCGEEVALADPFARCDCGSGALDWLGGDALRIKTVEVA
jgi:hydrogenase nickel incorporation protein HypA/HybF